jgi:hypothetical protein
MSALLSQIFAFIKSLFEWWYQVMPWERAIRVRAGKNAKVQQPGLYLKIPIIDRIYINEVRRRVAELPMQTLTTLDRQPITVKAAISYHIEDMLAMHNAMSHPETTIVGMVAGEIGKHIASIPMAEISHHSICEAALAGIGQGAVGLGGMEVTIISMSLATPLRLIQDNTYFYTEQIKMNHLGQ